MSRLLFRWRASLARRERTQVSNNNELSNWFANLITTIVDELARDHVHVNAVGRARRGTYILCGQTGDNCTTSHDCSGRKLGLAREGYDDLAELSVESTINKGERYLSLAWEAVPLASHLTGVPTERKGFVIHQ